MPRKNKSNRKIKQITKALKRAITTKRSHVEVAVIRIRISKLIIVVEVPPNRRKETPSKATLRVRIKAVAKTIRITTIGVERGEAEVAEATLLSSNKLLLHLRR